MDGNALNPDGTSNSMYYRYYFYHIPTNFEVITFTKELGRNWKLETKPYTYSYSNHQHLQKDQSQDSLHEVAVSDHSAVDKLNQYNRGGEITTLIARCQGRWGSPPQSRLRTPRSALDSRSP